MGQSDHIDFVGLAVDFEDDFPGYADMLTSLVRYWMSSTLSTEGGEPRVGGGLCSSYIYFRRWQVPAWVAGRTC